MARYFTGDDVTKQFDVEDAGGAVDPTSATVWLLKPDASSEELGSATIIDNRVAKIIDGEYNDLIGDYVVYFICELPTYGERTHSVSYRVQDNPI